MRMTQRKVKITFYVIETVAVLALTITMIQYIIQHPNDSLNAAIAFGGAVLILALVCGFALLLAKGANKYEQLPKE